MDPQIEAKYAGLGLLLETFAQTIGSFRALAIAQAQQLQAKDQEIAALKAPKVETPQA